MATERSQAETHLQKLRIFTGSDPLIQTFRESTDFKYVQSGQIGTQRFIFANGTFPGTTIGIANLNRPISTDVLQMTFSLVTFEEFASGRETTPFAGIQSGYFLPESSELTLSREFGMKVNLSSDFDPTKPAIRWTLDRIARAGILLEEYYANKGKPEEIELSDAEVLIVLNRLLNASPD